MSAPIHNPAALAIVANVLLVAVLPVNLLFRGETIAAGVMLAAGLLLLARLSGWNSFAARREPMLWILHLGYAWLGIGLILRAAAIFTGAFPEVGAVHAITVGALGSLAMGMLARVALGHTGRMMQADRWIIVAFVLVTLAALVRLTSLVGMPPAIAYGLSGVSWMSAFAFYLWRFIPVLLSPRAS